MSTPGPVKITVLALTLLLAMPLLAQRYQGRDHHVFHPAVQTKHPSAATGGATQTRAAASGNPAAPRNHDPNSNPSRSIDPAHPQMPPSTGTDHPR
jgi:hypothetical protein